MSSQSRRRPRLALEIIVVLVVKLAALAIIWNVWFSDPPARRFGPERIGAAVYSSASTDAAPRASHARP